ncbi:MAG: SGNH/GDSL hydrolase family protein [Candidatus Eisenbacteria bacterium]
MPATGDSAKLIVVIGSSTSAGTGASTADSAWVSRYRRYVKSFDPKAIVVNLAVGGYTTYHVMPTGYTPPANRPSPMPRNNITFGLTYKPWAIIVNLPSNDVSSGYSIEEQIANYDTLRARAAAAGVPIWITTSQPRNFATQVQRDQLRIMADSTMSVRAERDRPVLVPRGRRRHHPSSVRLRRRHPPERRRPPAGVREGGGGAGLAAGRPERAGHPPERG